LDNTTGARKAIGTRQIPLNSLGQLPVFKPSNCSENVDGVTSKLLENLNRFKKYNNVVVLIFVWMLPHQDFHYDFVVLHTNGHRIGGVGLLNGA
jgi:hypothetical protein